MLKTIGVIIFGTIAAIFILGIAAAPLFISFSLARAAKRRGLFKLSILLKWLAWTETTAYAFTLTFICLHKGLLPGDDLFEVYSPCMLASLAAIPISLTISQYKWMYAKGRNKVAAILKISVVAELLFFSYVLIKMTTPSTDQEFLKNEFEDYFYKLPPSAQAIDWSNGGADIHGHVNDAITFTINNSDYIRFLHRITNDTTFRKIKPRSQLYAYELKQQEEKFNTQTAYSFLSPEHAHTVAEVYIMADGHTIHTHIISVHHR